MISYNENNNHKNSRKIELMFKEYYEEQNALQLIDLNTINPYSVYDFRDDKNKIFIEVRHRREYNRNDLSYMLFNQFLFWKTTLFLLISFYLLSRFFLFLWT